MKFENFKPDFWKMFKTTEKGTFKIEKMKDEHFDVAQTRKCAECGSAEEMRWPELHLSFKYE